MKKNKGFTLIEMIVVIAIIGLLATVVFISLMGAQAKARDSQRASDLKQLQTAVEMFKEVNNRYPGDAGDYYVSHLGWKTYVSGSPGQAPGAGVVEDDNFANDLKSYLSVLPLEPKCKIFCPTNPELFYKYLHNPDRSGANDGYELDSGIEIREDLVKNDGGYSQSLVRSGDAFGGHYELGSKLYIMDCHPINHPNFQYWTGRESIDNIAKNYCNPS